jgi:hypothetical protein
MMARGCGWRLRAGGQTGQTARRFPLRRQLGGLGGVGKLAVMPAGPPPAKPLGLQRLAAHAVQQRRASSTGAGGSSGSTSWFARSEAANNAHPLLVRGTVGVILYGISDCVAQYLQSVSWDRFALDYNRMAGMCSWRFLVFTPVFYTFYLVMDVAVYPLVGARMVLTKLCIDLFLMGPSITVTFFMWNQLAEKGFGRYEEALEHTQMKLWPAMIIGWVWCKSSRVVWFVIMGVF